MPIKFEVLGALGGVLALMLLLLLFLRARRRKLSGAGTGRPSGPANSRFICASCARQFPHSKRTLKAWDKGSRRFFCALCHAAWSEESQALDEEPESRR